MPVLFFSFARIYVPRVLAWYAVLALTLKMAFVYQAHELVVFLLVFGSLAIALLEAARGIGRNLSWLHVTPISRSRLWWLNCLCNALAFGMFLLFLFGVIWFKASHVAKQVPWRFDTDYALLIVLVQSLLVMPLVYKKVKRHLSIEHVFIPIAFAPLLLPYSPLGHVLWFVALSASAALFGARYSVTLIRLPRDSARRFYWRYALATSALVGAGLMFLA